MQVATDLVEQTFGELFVVARATDDEHERDCWLAWCECGVLVTVSGDGLRAGLTTHCGCQNRRHGLSKTRIYHKWHEMIRRCTDPRRPDWKNYGNRGIQVCERWLDFANFLADMGHPSPGETLERLDNDGDYSPENCVWADRKTQARNRRNTRYVEWRGETRKLAELIEESGLPNMIVRNRLHMGWSLERALTTVPVRRRRRRVS